MQQPCPRLASEQQRRRVMFGISWLLLALVVFMSTGASTSIPEQHSSLEEQTNHLDTTLVASSAAHQTGSRRALLSPTKWMEQFPPELFTTRASPYQAQIAVLEQRQAANLLPGPTTAGLAVVEPLQPVTLAVRIADYSGPAVLRIYDSAINQVAEQKIQLRSGQRNVTIVPRGQLGPQWTLILVDGQLAGAYRQLLTLEASTTIDTGDPDLDLIYPRVRSFLAQDVVSYELDGRTIRGYRSPDNPLIWLRDHVYQNRGYRYFEHDMTSTLDAFRVAQLPDGSFPDVLDYPERDVTAHRLDPESDLEFLFVQGVYEAWQVTGDDEWLRHNLRAMRRALNYITSDPLRWDAELGLVRRPFTIDMWDFQFGPATLDPDTGEPAPRHWFDEQTRWGIFHGDNTGLAYAMRLMGRMERYLGNAEAAQEWDSRRRTLTANLMKTSWNGAFFTHFVPLEGELEIAGVDTDKQLSLSNTYALNREILEFDQAQSIIQSYFQRRDFERSFAEWYAIDPPFPPGSFGMGGRPGDNPGEYVNGGVMPLTGGELARGAFRYSSVEYAFDILHRYADLVRLTGESYLWYYPTGAPGISGVDTLSTDGWGSSAMLGALVEGAAGVEDRGQRYNDLLLSPRWAGEPTLDRVYVVTRYGASDGYVAYTWERSAKALTLDLTGSWERARIRLLLPAEGISSKHTVTVRVDGELISTRIEKELSWRYVEVEVFDGNTRLDLTWE